MSLQKNGGWKKRKQREQSSCNIEQPISKQEGEKTIVEGLELNIFFFKKRSGTSSTIRPALFLIAAYVTHAFFLFGPSSLPIGGFCTVDFIFPFSPSSALVSSGPYIHAYFPFILSFCVLFSLLFAHIFTIHPSAHINFVSKLFFSILSSLLCELSILIHYTLYTTSSLLLRRVTTIGCSIDLETDASIIIDSGTCESSSRMFRNRYVHGAPERSIRRKPVDDFAHPPTGETPRSQAMISLKISKEPFRI